MGRLLLLQRCFFSLLPPVVWNTTSLAKTFKSIIQLTLSLKLCIRSRPSFLITSYLSLSMPFRDLKPNISTNQTHLASIMKPVSFLESYLLMIPPFYSSPQAISSFHSLFISHFYYCQWLRIKHYPMNSTFISCFYK